jgi:hypothetical protein
VINIAPGPNREKLPSTRDPHGVGGRRIQGAGHIRRISCEHGIDQGVTELIRVLDVDAAAVFRAAVADRDVAQDEAAGQLEGPKAREAHVEEAEVRRAGGGAALDDRGRRPVARNLDWAGNRGQAVCVATGSAVGGRDRVRAGRHVNDVESNAAGRALARRGS